MASRIRVTIAMIVLLVGLTIILSVPLTPQIIGYVRISTLDNHPSVELISVVYQRINLISGISEPRDKMEVRQSSANNTRALGYFLSVVVQYQGQLVIQGGSEVTEGIVFFKGSFWFRYETANIPYVVTFTISNGGYDYETVQATLQPS